MLGGGGVNGHFSLFLNVAFSYGVIKNRHFQSTLLGGRGSQKRVLCVRFW